MARFVIPYLAVALLLVLPGASPGAGVSAPAAFDTTSIRFEQNATDGDAEVVFVIKAGDEGLARLTVTSPDGRAVLELTAPDAATLGMRSFALESPEPKDMEGLKAAYPEGEYAFAGTSVSGKRLRGAATLSHALPAPVEVLRPGPEAVRVGAEGVGIAWTTVPGAVAYIVEIEQEALAIELEARLPAPMDAFVVPRELLQPGLEYVLAIASVAANGNLSFVETTFVTAE